ncbi:RHS repeat-associated core domain-containing protein [Pseudomonas sp. lyk4-R2A-10]|uniref:RHS repeat-associated core domain-containing protein n=2 Tax=Pseudomonas TaxID=286 RepID=UPI002557C1EA|nr:RHS repeat-associated core domain-containing protein [Pseudomonas sp. lyk4-R2A-10]
MDAVTRIEQELDSFPRTLDLYREQLKHWLSRSADGVSHAADLPSLMGMERIIRFGEHSTAVAIDDNRFSSAVVQCPYSGRMEIESKFESAYDIPLGDIVVDVVAVEGGAVESVTLDVQGKGVFTGEAGKFYRVVVHGGASEQQVDALFESYDGLTRQLDGWLRSEWQGFKPQWSQSVATAAGNGMLAGSWAAIEGVWDSIGLLSEILQDPGKFDERLGSGAAQLIALAETAPEMMEKLQLLVSDEAALCLLLRTASLWLEMLPPSEIAGKTAEAVSMVVVQLLIDVLIGVVLTFVGAGAGIAYLTLRLAERGAQLLSAVTRLVKAMFGIVSTFIGYVNQYKSVAARGIAAGVKKGRMQLRWDARRNASLKKDEHHDDTPDQAKNPNGDSADCAPRTCTNGCPVSMVTGEELLTLTDGVLDGLLSFEFSRLYRSSAVEIDVGLGFGWSHSLAHRLEVEGAAVVWVDHENRRTRFPLPSVERPEIHNSLSRAAIFLGDEPEELIVALAGDAARFYHFRAGRLTAVSDAYGNRLRITRDRLDRVERLDNGAGRSLLLRYERAHLVAVDYQVFRESAWRTEQTLARYRFDARHRLIEATNAVGESERYDYDDQHVILQRQLSGGASFFWAWERAGKAARCVRHWASFSQMDTRYVWDDAGRVTVQYVDGREEVYVHDDTARLVRQVSADGGEQLKAYDAQGRLVAEQDALGAVTEYRYDDAGRLIALIPPDDAPTSYEYRNGFLHSRSRGDAVWTYRRNAQGDITEAVDPDGHVTHYHHDAQGRLLSIRYPDSGRHVFVWNDLGQLVEESLPDGGVRKFSYDALGRRITAQDEHGAVTRHAWDAVGRLIQTTSPNGATRAWSYSAYGQITAERDELGRITRYEYDDDLHLVSRRINPDGTRLQYRYDHAQLLLTEIENESGEKYRLDYTPTGLIRQETGFDGRRTAYVYDRNGHLLEKTEYGDDGSTLVTTYQRDSAGRLLLKTLPDGVEVSYRYDRLGRLVGVDDGLDHPLAFEYDLQDRLVREHQGWGTLRYTYDACGQLTRMRLPDNSKLDYHYAKGGALTAIDLNGALLTRHVYQNGREQQRQQGLLLSEYTYDEQGCLRAHAVGHQRSALYRRDFAYSANGNLEHIADTRHGQRSYTYDALDRLIRVRHTRDDLPENFAHDPAGNLLMQDRPGPTQIKGNRLQMQGDRHYDYDAFGNLIRERRGRAQTLVTEYRYDSQHRLIGLTRPDGTSATYQYDAFGRRIRKTVNGQTTEFFWQGDHLIAESSPTQHRSFIYEPGTFHPLAMLDGQGPKRACPFYYQLDHLGTPQELTDYSGDIVWSAKYSAYGKVTSLELATEDYLNQPLRFQGQYFDDESGLHYNRHRYYDPDVGRYLTPDPVKLAGGLNQYRYVPNPTGWVDPLGLTSNCPPPKNNKIQKCSVPIQANKPNVNQGLPIVPAVGKDGPKNEAEAKRQVLAWNRQYRMHSVEKHGPEIDDAALKQRSIDGSHPTKKGVRGMVGPSSQFRSWMMQFRALHFALSRMHKKVPEPTGYDADQNPIVRMKLPGAGRGYKPNERDLSNPRYIDSLDGAEVKFDKRDITRPFTGFPR